VLRRHRQRRRLAAAAAVAVAALGTAFGAAGLRSQPTDQAVISATVPPAGAPPTAAAPDLLAGPDGPTDSPSGGTPPIGSVYGRAYPIGTATGADGRRLTEVVFVAKLRFGAAGVDTGVYSRPWLCTAQWQPGSALSAAMVDGCAARATAQLTDEVKILGPAAPPAGGAADPGVHAQQIMTFRRDVARADLLYALPSDLTATASTDGGHPPVRLRLPVTLLGADQRAMPVLIGTADPLPTGYDLVGVDAWNADGQHILHEIGGLYCGPDPKSGKTFLVCPSRQQPRAGVRLSAQGHAAFAVRRVS